jgi:TPR repeat protein
VCFGVLLGSGFVKQIQRKVGLLLSPDPAQVTLAKKSLSFGSTMFGGLAKQIHRKGGVLLGAEAMEVAFTQRSLRFDNPIECYSRGEGVEKSLKTAADFFLKAALQEHPAAQFRLGECYLHGKGVEPNPASHCDVMP